VQDVKEAAEKRQLNSGTGREIFHSKFKYATVSLTKQQKCDIYA
jgi:hypothetical protein